MLNASIDIGTNSVRLLIADVRPNNVITPILKKVDVVRLGEGVDKNKELNLFAMERCINQLKEYKNILNEYKIQNINIIATSAVRDSNNRNIFFEKFKKELDWEFVCVSGDEEANLTFLGVKSDFPSSEPLLVFDIGGGSTEFILEKEDNKLQIFSINVGSVRMTERFIKNYPISDDSYSKMKLEIKKLLTPALNVLKIKKHKLIGVAGTVTTLAAMDQKLDPYDSKKVHKYNLSYNNILKLHEEIKIKTLDEIKKMKGLHPKRSDVVLAGSLISLIVMEMLSFSSMMVSESELLEGIILKNVSNT